MIEREKSLLNLNLCTLLNPNILICNPNLKDFTMCKLIRFVQIDPFCQLLFDVPKTLNPFCCWLEF